MDKKNSEQQQMWYSGIVLHITAHSKKARVVKDADHLNPIAFPKHLNCGAGTFRKRDFTSGLIRGVTTRTQPQQRISRETDQATRNLEWYLFGDTKSNPLQSRPAMTLITTVLCSSLGRAQCVLWVPNALAQGFRFWNGCIVIRCNWPPLSLSITEIFETRIQDLALWP